MSLFHPEEERETATLLGKRMGPLYESAPDREFFSAAVLGGKIAHEKDTCLAFHRDKAPPWGNRDDLLLFLYAPAEAYADFAVGSHGTVSYVWKRLKSFTPDDG